MTRQRFPSFLGFIQWFALTALAGVPPSLAADKPPAPVAGLLVNDAPSATAEESARIGKLAQLTREVFEECYRDTENERDPHIAPDWCQERSKKVLQAVGKDGAMAARVLAVAVYDASERPVNSLDPKLMKPSKGADVRDVLAGELHALADLKVMAYEGLARLSIHRAAQISADAAAYDDEFFRNELSIWTGWRVCQTSDRYAGDSKACNDAWVAWFNVHGKETPGQWQESAAVARLEDLRSADLARRDWAVQPWHRLGDQQPLGSSHFAEVAWVLHDAMVPGKLTVEQSDHFERMAEAYKCSTRCVLFPPPLAGRTLPAAPLTLAEGKPLLRPLPPRPRDAATQWQQPVVPAALRAKLKKLSKIIDKVVASCWNPVGYSEPDEPALCEPGRNALDSGVEAGAMAAHVLAAGYFDRWPWDTLKGWHSAQEDDDYAEYSAVPLKLLRQARRTLP